MIEMFNVDIFQATIAELQPVEGLKALTDRSIEWSQDRLAMLVRAWGIYADEHRRQCGYGIFGMGSPNALQWRDMGLMLRDWVTASDAHPAIVDAIILRILEHEGCATDILEPYHD